MTSIKIQTGIKVKVLYRMRHKLIRGEYTRSNPFDEIILDKGEALMLDAFDDELVDIVKMD